jgi:hypothetical protein
LEAVAVPACAEACVQEKFEIQIANRQNKTRGLNKLAIKKIYVSNKKREICELKV